MNTTLVAAHDVPITNWYCIEVKQGQSLARKLVIATSVRDQLGHVVDEPNIGTDVIINTVQGIKI